MSPPPPELSQLATPGLTMSLLHLVLSENANIKNVHLTCRCMVTCFTVNSTNYNTNLLSVSHTHACGHAHATHTHTHMLVCSMSVYPMVFSLLVPLGADTVLSMNILSFFLLLINLPQGLDAKKYCIIHVLTPLP